MSPTNPHDTEKDALLLSEAGSQPKPQSEPQSKTPPPPSSKLSLSSNPAFVLSLITLPFSCTAVLLSYFIKDRTSLAVTSSWISPRVKDAYMTTAQLHSFLGTSIAWPIPWPLATLIYALANLVMWSTVVIDWGDCSWQLRAVLRSDGSHGDECFTTGKWNGNSNVNSRSVEVLKMVRFGVAVVVEGLLVLRVVCEGRRMSTWWMPWVVVLGTLGVMAATIVWAAEIAGVVGGVWRAMFRR